MMKYLFMLFLHLYLYGSISIPSDTRQLLVVSAKDFDSSLATLQAYEQINKKWTKAFPAITVNLGRNGMGWGKGLIEFEHRKDEPIKVEGDGKSPAGLFALEHFFGYEQKDFAFPYLRVDEKTLCIDDSDSSFYNQIIRQDDKNMFKSFEYMKRNDSLYRLGIVVNHNTEKIKNQGSCIFIHIQKSQKAPTAGCTSMDEDKLLKIMKWLNKKEVPLLLQLPENYLPEAFK